jgi:hypothetical protein
LSPINLARILALAAIQSPGDTYSSLGLEVILSDTLSKYCQREALQYHYNLCLFVMIMTIHSHMCHCVETGSVDTVSEPVCGLS